MANYKKEKDSNRFFKDIDEEYPNEDYSEEEVSQEDSQDYGINDGISEGRDPDDDNSRVIVERDDRIVVDGPNDEPIEEIEIVAPGSKSGKNKNNSSQDKKQTASKADNGKGYHDTSNDDSDDDSDDDSGEAPEDDEDILWAPKNKDSKKDNVKADKKENKKHEKQKKKEEKKSANMAAFLKKEKSSNNDEKPEHKEKKGKSADKKHHKKPKKKKAGFFWIIIGLLAVIAIVLIIVFSNKPSPTGPADSKDDDFKDSIVKYSGTPVKMELYAMSQCPYGIQMEEALFPVVKALGEGLDLSVEYIASINTDGSFRSLHGQPEIDGNIIQLCAKEHYPDRYFYFINCQNKNDPSNLKASVEKCSNEFNMDSNVIMSCFNGNEGKKLFEDSIAQSQAKMVTGSPTTYIDGTLYAGRRDSLSIQKALCAKISDHTACKDLPVCGSDADCQEFPDKDGTCQNPGTETATCVYTVPPKVEVTILNLEECKTCDPSQIAETVKVLFKGAEIRYVDANTEEGKSLVEKYGITFVPAYLFDSAIETTYMWTAEPRLKDTFEKMPDGSYKIKDEATGSDYYVDEKVRQERLEDMGISFGDNRPQIDFFIMSYCPYGNQAEEAIKPAYDKLKDVADFNPVYIIYSNYGGGGPKYCLDVGNKYCSMHGIQELNQNIREVCVADEYGMDKWFEFAMAMNKECTYQNADTCWKGVADKLSIDNDKIEKCYDDRAEEISAEHLEITNKFSVTGSPTVFIDGTKYTGSRTAQGYAETLCAAFDNQPAECKDLSDLETATATNTATGEC